MTFGVHYYDKKGREITEATYWKNKHDAVLAELAALTTPPAPQVKAVKLPGKSHADIDDEEGLIACSHHNACLDLVKQAIIQQGFEVEE